MRVVSTNGFADLVCVLGWVVVEQPHSPIGGCHAQCLIVVLHQQRHAEELGHRLGARLDLHSPQPGRSASVSYSKRVMSVHQVTELAFNSSLSAVAASVLKVGLISRMVLSPVCWSYCWIRCGHTASHSTSNTGRPVAQQGTCTWVYNA